MRLVKGIYVEPPELAYTDPALINRDYMALLDELVDLGCRWRSPPTTRRWWASPAAGRERRLAPDRYEFQLLLGVRSRSRDKLIAAGHRVRIYVPYGEAWYGYSLRRLKENPSIAGYVARDVVRGLAGRR